MDVTEEGGEGDSVGGGGYLLLRLVRRERERLGGRRDGGSGYWENIPYASLVSVLSKMTDNMKQSCMRDAGISMAAASGSGMSHCSELDREDEFSPRLAPPAQEDADKTPCG